MSNHMTLYPDSSTKRLEMAFHFALYKTVDNLLIVDARIFIFFQMACKKEKSATNSLRSIIYNLIYLHINKVLRLDYENISEIFFQ